MKKNFYQNFLIFIYGPTASGKTKMAETLAKEFNANIINADCQQMYKGISILGNHSFYDPNIKYDLFEILEPDEDVSFSKWANLAHAKITKQKNEQKISIVVGGNGMYQRLFIDGIQNLPESDKLILKECEDFVDKNGIDAFFKKTIEIDPLVQKHLNPNDKQRLIRAFCVKKQSGKSMFDKSSKLSHFSFINSKSGFIGFKINPDRDELYSVCEKRFLEMIKLGAVDEVKKILKRNLNQSTTFKKTIGLKEISGYIKNEIDLNSAIEESIKSTRHYAKRQYTWLKNKFDDFTEIKNPQGQLSLMIKSIKKSYNKFTNKIK